MMPRVVYVNGRYVPYGRALIHCEDRGYQFADAVYEVLGIYKGRPVDLDGHWARLFRSLGEVEIKAPFTPDALTFIAREVVQRNLVSTGTVYIQISRGVSLRNHYFPAAETPPGIVILARSGLGPGEATVKKGVRLLTQPDLRWKRCDIKSVGLLPNVMAKQRAHEQGAFEALLVNEADNTVTECGSSNVWIVTPSGDFITRPLGDDILPGVTRHRLRDLAKEAGHPVIERRFTLDEALNAKEVFLSSTGSFALPVVRINDTIIGDGRPGPMVTALRADYVRYLDRSTEPVWRR